jgi:cytochrome c oxidase assembly factor CtaG
MSPGEAALFSWSFPPWLTAFNIFAAFLYAQGWSKVRFLVPDRLRVRHLLSFLSGLASLQIALSSPIDAFDAFFLTDHMSQHLLLMMVVPPLILLGNPAIPLLRGLPRTVRRAIGMAIRSKPLRWLLRVRTHPALCWIAFAFTMIGWHLPRPYDLVLRASGWHEIEHLTFLLTSTLFWWPVIQPWPSRAHWPRWSMILYLLLADVVNSVLSAFLVFSGRVLYPYYLGMPRLNGLSVANDQVLAGAVMWVVGSIAFIIPGVAIALKLLSPSGPVRTSRVRRISRIDSRQHIFLTAAICFLPLAALAYGFLTAGAIDIDDDVPQAQTSSGPFLVTLFAPRDAVETGSAELAVLVRDSRSNLPLPEALVQITASRISMGGGLEIASASTARTTNRLLHGARIGFPSQGMWEVDVTVQGDDARTATLTTQMEVK